MAAVPPSETSPLLVPPPRDDDTEANAAPTASEEVEDVKDLGNRIYILLPAVAIGVRPYSLPFSVAVLTLCHVAAALCP